MKGGAVARKRTGAAPSRGAARARSCRRVFFPIGVPAPGGMLRDLPRVDDDLARMRRAFTALDYAVVDTRPNPSVAELRAMLGAPLDEARLGQADALVLYFSGHGLVVGGDHYLCPRGFARDDVGSTGLKTSELIEQVVRRKWRPGRFWLILDCCQAGGVIEDGLLATMAVAGADAFVLAASGSWGQSQDGTFSRAFCAAVRRMGSGERGVRGTLDSITQDINRRCSPALRAVQATVCSARFDLLDDVP